LHAERIDSRSVCLSQPRAAEIAGWVVLLRMIAVTEVKCASQDADRVKVDILEDQNGIVLYSKYRAERPDHDIEDWKGLAAVHRLSAG